LHQKLRMNNYRNNRKNRFKSHGERNFRKRSINGHKNQSEFNPNSDFKHRSPGKNNHNAAKLVDKYNNLAREALSSGDKILSENYLQHADHFTRILSLQEINKSEISTNNVIEKDFKKDFQEIKSEEKEKNS
jgi:hypothetical protein